MKNDSGQIKFHQWMLLITLLALGLRLLWLSQHGLWIDELYSVRDAVRIFKDPITSIAKTVRMVGYLPITVGLYMNDVDLYQIDVSSPEKWAMQGISLWTLRIIPALIGTITIPLLAYASRGILKEKTVLILALLLAVSPWHIYWSQLGRFYITQFLFYNLALILYFTATEERSLRKIILAMSCCILAFASQLTSAIFFVVIVGDWLLCKLRRNQLNLNRSSYLIVTAAACIMAAMFLTILLGSEKSWLENLQEGRYSRVAFVTQTLYFVGPLVILLALGTQFINVIDNRRLLNYLLIAAVIPIIVFTVISFRGHFRPRYAFVCYFSWLTLAAIGVTQLYEWLKLRLGKIPASVPLVLLLTSMTLQNGHYYFYNFGLRPRWNEAANYVRMHHRPGEKIIFNTVWLGEYYLSDLNAKISSTPEEIETINQPCWIVTRNKKHKVMKRQSFLSKAEPEASFVSTNTLGEIYDIDVYHFN